MPRILASFVVIFATLSFGCIKPDREFVPVYLTEDGLVERRDSLNLEMIQNIQRVFEFYKVEHRVENGRVLYKGFIDEELLWNYTTKAKVKKWLKRHK
jgi:hypothetical protein